jgi:hypothetical protein
MISGCVREDPCTREQTLISDKASEYFTREEMRLLRVAGIDLLSCWHSSVH